MMPSYRPLLAHNLLFLLVMERVDGIEPTSSAWKAVIMTFILHSQNQITQQVGESQSPSPLLGQPAGLSPPPT